MTTTVTLNNQHDVIDTRLAYWKQRLDGASAQLELPTDFSRTEATSYRNAHCSFALSKCCHEALNQLSLQYGTTLSITLVTAFNILLYRYTGREDILIGFSLSEHRVSGAGEPEHYLYNTLPLRTDLSGNPSFWELLSQIQENAAGAAIYNDLPFEVLKEILKSEKSSNNTPLLPVVFTFRERAATAIRVDPEKTQSAIPDFAIAVEETTEGITGICSYNSNLFKSDTINRMAEHFRLLLAGIVANPEQQISGLPLLSAAERLQILFEWNNTYAPFPADKCIHELIEEQAKCTPDAIAVTVYDVTSATSGRAIQEVTYKEVNARANQLAHYLRKMGVGPEVVVGICVARSVDMVVGLLGILKAGGAYMPLDPSYPEQRLRFMLTDSKVPLLLTQQRLLEKLPSHEAKVICLDEDWHDIAPCSSENGFSSVKPHNLAYVIYTSGSTGVPKGTLIIHRGVVNYLSWCSKEYNVEDGSGAPVNSSFAFDATVTSLFSPLLAGKRVVLLPEEGEIEALAHALLSRSHFSLIKITPAHLRILQYLLPPHKVNGQANVFVIGGEALLGKDINLWHTYASGTRLINEYGPTETVVGCCTYEVTDQHSLVENIPIGRPIANTQMYILDRYLQPVPIGVAGEIYIGGAGLARGYLNRPDLTAERFVSNPFNTDGESRLYKTGDLARFLDDGNILFLGRIDQQVKVRGYRIELGEIESALSQHSSVQEIVVMLREDDPGNKRLVAYLVLREEHILTINDIRHFLEKKLPEYMVPSAILFLKSMPLTANGKIDRAALPAPNQERPALEKIFVAPRNAVEAGLRKIWEECLTVSSISVNDNFFELGGNSIQAARMFSQIQKTFGKRLPLAILFQASTIEKLALSLYQDKKAAPWSSLVPIQPNGSKPTLFCIHAGAGTVLFYHSLAHHLGADQPLYGLQAKGLNGNEPPHTRIEDMAAHYIREIQAIQPEGAYFLAGYCLGGILAFEIAQQLISQGYKVALLANFNGVSPTYVHPPHLTIAEDDEVLPQSTESLYHKISSHWEKFTFLTTKGKLIYPLKLAARNLLTYKQQAKLRKLLYKYYLALNQPLPEGLGKMYFLETNDGMATAYIPKPYPGNMIIFRSPEIYEDPYLGWNGLVAGGIETCDIAGGHKNRREIMNEPFVQNTANELKKYLQG